MDSYGCGFVVFGAVPELLVCSGTAVLAGMGVLAGLEPVADVP